MKLDIENKILIPFLLLIIVPTLVVGGFFYWNSNQLFLDSQKNNMKKDLLLVVNYLDFLARDVKQGNLTVEEARNKSLQYLEEGWTDVILVFDKKKKKELN